MTAFILRKTAANMPFAELETSEIVKLGTNTSVHQPISSIKTTITVSTQTTECVDLDAYDSLNSVKEGLNRENTELKRSSEQLRSENNSLSYKLHQCSLDVATLSTQADMKDGIIKELESDVRALKNACDECSCLLTDITNKLSRSTDEIVSLKREIARLQKQQQQKQQALHNCESELSLAQSEITDLMLELWQARQQHPPFNQQSYTQPHPESYENMQPHPGSYIEPHQHPYNPPYQQQQAPPGRQRSRRGPRRGH